ncbi:MAG: SpoIIE family protein phosphatase [Bacteroidia bacterium]|nr:SpoIIE family protein phosphatase [Bacteroidia bacterium]
MEHLFNYALLLSKLYVPFSYISQKIDLGFKAYKNYYSEGWEENITVANSNFEVLEKNSLLSVSDLKGNIIYVNEKFCKVSKYTSEELIGMPHNIIHHPDTSSSVFKEMWQTISRGNIWQGEIKNRTKDGSFYWVYATVFPVIGNNGKPIKYITMRQDITAQKLAVEQLNFVTKNNYKHLYENVNYAKKVHSLFLTPETTLQELFPESFLIYKAQSIISGDFYMVRNKEDKTILVLGDSTGHGVSASYISVMVLNILNRFLRLSSYCPAKILEDLHHEILLSTNSDEASPTIESADMGFCIIDHKNMILEYSLAKMRGVVIRNGETIELKRDKYSIGEHSCREINLVSTKLQLQKGDTLYLYTDGIIDQFGGEKDKKLTNKRLLNELKINSNSLMSKQKQDLINVLTTWQGDHEQTDDITIMGVKIL